MALLFPNFRFYWGIQVYIIIVNQEKDIVQNTY